LGLIAAGQVTIGVELILDLLKKKNKPIVFYEKAGH